MAEGKKNLKIRFEGRLDNLVINYGGKVLYSYKREKKKERGKTEKQKAAQSKTAITAALCSEMNNIPALKHIWKQWPDKKKKPYRNMLSANLRHTSPEHLTIYNMISPKTQYESGCLCKSFDTSGLEIETGDQEYSSISTETGKTFSIIVIVCLYNPAGRKRQSYKLLMLSQEIEKFDPMENYRVKFPFDSETQKEIRAYGNCIIYTTVVYDKLAGEPRKWLNAFPTDYILTKGKGEIRS